MTQKTIAKKKEGTRKPPVKQEGEHAIVKIADIDFSPFNYRKYYSKQALNDFASELKQHGIIAPLLVRRSTEERYELVAGERRLRAAKIARLQTVPVIIKELTEEEVIEMQLAENLQREDPHPFHEAQQIGRMMDKGLSVEETAARIGKSKAFVYNRSKLLSLIEPFQEMVLADAITLQQAISIATIAPESQTQLFENECSDWKESENFELYNLTYQLSRFTYDLHKAPFNTKDKNLLPEAGACSRCPFNTATLKSLFPEYAKEATCTNKSCYDKKNTASFYLQLVAAFAEYQPQAILHYNTLSAMLQDALSRIPEAASLPLYNRHSVFAIEQPAAPDKDDYEEVDDETGEVVLNEEYYQEAVKEFEEERQEYNKLLQSPSLHKGLLVHGDTFEPVLFDPERKETNSSQQPTVTAKQVQEAIKEGTATPDLLHAEIARINAREERAKELDAEKVQLAVHEQFEAALLEGKHTKKAAESDLLATRFLIYQTLDYHSRNKVNQFLFKTETGYGLADDTLSLLSGLSEKEHAFLIRMALLNNSSSKLPSQSAGRLLKTVAASSGFDVNAIEQQQEEKATVRQQKAQEKIAVLENKIEVVQPVA
jgi:ParB family chromosome partitioning protein